MIRIVEDVVVPAGVFVADYATSRIDEAAAVDAFKWNKPMGVALGVLGYLGAGLDFGGDMVKNIGIASFDWAASSIAEYIREAMKPKTTSQRLEMRPASKVKAAINPDEYKGAVILT